MAAVARVIPSSASVASSPQHPNASPTTKHRHQQHLNVVNVHRIALVHKGLLLSNRPRLCCKAVKGNASFPSQMKPSAFPFNVVSYHGLDDDDAAARSGNVWGAAATESASASAPGVAQRSAEADVMGLLLKQRIVFLGHQMDDFVADAIVSQLLLLDANDPTKDIRLFINCPGGSMSAAMGIFDAIQLCRSDVSTIAFGLAASTASIVLAAGTRGKRFAMPNTRIMVHQPMGGASGQALDVEIQAKEIMHHKANCLRILSQITGKSIETVEKDINRDRYMSPVEALEYGLIDGVIDKDSIIPLVPIPEKISRRPDIKNAESDPRKFLMPVVPDDEIY